MHRHHRTILRTHLRCLVVSSCVAAFHAFLPAPTPNLVWKHGQQSPSASSAGSSRLHSSDSSSDEVYRPPDFTVLDDEEDDNFIRVTFSDEEEEGEDEDEEPRGSKRNSGKKGATKRSDDENESPRKYPPTRPKRPTHKRSNSPAKMEGTNWMQKNNAFNNEERDGDDQGERPNKTFREDFRGTRVFVTGLSPQATWQELKDHFRLAGEVVFASVSVDYKTGVSKGCGIVQYENSEMARFAIQEMRNHPLDGQALFVREDVQERPGDRELRPRAEGRGGEGQKGRRDTRNPPPAHWECADDQGASVLSTEERNTVTLLIRTRDSARRQKNYDTSDEIRQQLLAEYGVHVDDRLKQWWVSFDGGHVPQKIKAVRGEGRWGDKKAWRQIPTTPENDACVNADLVNGLLTQRDIARREKDFSTADSLLEEARTSPDGELALRIHDESRTWRVWTTEKPPRSAFRSGRPRLSAAEQCIELVMEKAPHKEEEIRTLLEKFPGREYNILKKLRKALLSSDE